MSVVKAAYYIKNHLLVSTTTVAWQNEGTIRLMDKRQGMHCNIEIKFNISGKVDMDMDRSMILNVFLLFFLPKGSYIDGYQLQVICFCFFYFQITMMSCGIFRMKISCNGKKLPSILEMTVFLMKC